MYHPKNKQGYIFSIENTLTKKKLERLCKTWAYPFREYVLPEIDEEKFRHFYDKEMGAPNKPIQTMVSLLILKDMFNLTYDKLIEQFEWDARFHYALDVLPEEAHICQKTLHNFSIKLLQDEKLVDLVYNTITKSFIKKFEIEYDEQRIDSTHIKSNMMELGRLGLFVKTLESFLRYLKKYHWAKVSLPERFTERYYEREGYFSDVSSRKAPRRLLETAEDIWFVLQEFSSNKSISSHKSYQLLERLFYEQCRPPENETPLEIKPSKEISSDSLQNPSDSDASYDAFKGKGYQVQASETCNPDNDFQVFTDVESEGAHEHDANALLPMAWRLRKKGLTPKIWYGDTHYTGNDNYNECASFGIELHGPVPGQDLKDDKIELAEFDISETDEIIRCPNGIQPTHQKVSEKKKLHSVHFSLSDCSNCPDLERCPVTKQKKSYVLNYYPDQLLSSQRRLYQKTKEFKEKHKSRSGIESSFSECKRTTGVGHLRVRGKKRVSLAVKLKFLGTNIRRMTRYVLKTSNPPKKEAISTISYIFKELLIFLMLIIGTIYKSFKIIAKKDNVFPKRQIF